MKVSLIITTYHADSEMAELTRNCLASLGDERPDEVIVVDDASPVHVRLEGADRVVYRGENGGFPKCANTGFAETTGDVLILSNNDITYSSGWLEAILKPLEQGFDISSLRVSDADGLETKDEITEDDFFGSLWAMKRRVYDTIGGFDERFEKGTFEDKDYHLRAQEAGFRIGKNHAVVVEHKGRATMDKIYPEREDFLESRRLFEAKHGFVL